MKSYEPRDPLFAPFREAQAPRGFTAKVMDRIHREYDIARDGWVVAGAIRPGWRRLADLFKTRWMWVAGSVAAVGVYFLMARPSVSVSVTGTDVSFYLADSATVEDEAVLGTDIENIFL